MGSRVVRNERTGNGEKPKARNAHVDVAVTYHVGFLGAARSAGGSNRPDLRGSDLAMLALWNLTLLAPVKLADRELGC